MNDEARTPPLSSDPALALLDRFVGAWTMAGSTAGSEEPNIEGTATYRWLPGGFFLEQHVELDFAGMAHIDSLELIGYDPETGTYPSRVYANMSPQPLPYTWSIDGDEVTITVSHGPLDATFSGRFGPDCDTFGGCWRPNPGADETVNFPYDVHGRRIGTEQGEREESEHREQ